MKYLLITIIRPMGLLKIADTINYWIRRLRLSLRNGKFLLTHPDFPVPPHDLAYDAYNHCDWEAYHDSGLAHGRIFADIILKHTGENDLRVLEWGCGPARLIRHLPALLAEKNLELNGADYNSRTIHWCRENINGVNFVLNGLLPPLAFPDDYFDVVYNFSVFTHLSEGAQLAWSNELFRVLKPGGILICTTHGDNYRYLLVRQSEKKRYESGEVVIQGRYSEGKKWFFAVHPPAFVKDVLLERYADVLSYTPQEMHGVLQDIWIARKP